MLPINSSSKFYERLSDDHGLLIGFINDLIGKPLMFVYPQKHKEFCLFLCTQKFHDAATYLDKGFMKYSIEVTVCLLRPNGLIQPRRLVFRNSNQSNLIRIRPRRHSSILSISPLWTIWYGLKMLVYSKIPFMKGLFLNLDWFGGSLVWY